MVGEAFECWVWVFGTVWGGGFWLFDCWGVVEVVESEK